MGRRLCRNLILGEVSVGRQRETPELYVRMWGAGVATVPEVSLWPWGMGNLGATVIGKAQLCEGRGSGWVV